MGSVISICNKGIRYLGGEEILALSQETKAARLCAQYYEEVRDELLEEFNWSFATRYTSLAQLPDAPPFGFSRAYQLPTECLRVRSLRDNEPFEVVERKTLYTDVSPCEAVITVRVTDTTQYPALFVEVLARKLASELAVPLMNSTRLEKTMVAKYLDAVERAKAADSVEGAVPLAQANSWVVVRG